MEGPPLLCPYLLFNPGPASRCSCLSLPAVLQGYRKPAIESYRCAVDHLELPPSDLMLIDDRQPNVEGARTAGLQAILFKDAAQLETELKAAGLVF